MTTDLSSLATASVARVAGILAAQSEHMAQLQQQEEARRILAAERAARQRAIRERRDLRHQQQENKGLAIAKEGLQTLLEFGASAEIQTLLSLLSGRGIYLLNLESIYDPQMPDAAVVKMESGHIRFHWGPEIDATEILVPYTSEVAEQERFLERLQWEPRLPSIAKIHSDGWYRSDGSEGSSILLKFLIECAVDSRLQSHIQLAFNELEKVLSSQDAGEDS